jgi:hypothetical protein
VIPSARWDAARDGVVLVLPTGGQHFLWPEEARGVVAQIGEALKGDDDPTPALGTKVHMRALRMAWRLFAGDMVHGVQCAARDVEVMGSAKSGDDRCDCGLRALVLAFEAMEGS